MVEIVYRCPECRLRLKPKPLTRGAAWTCSSCAGVCVNVAVLRQHASEPIVQELWASARDRSRESERACPSCAQPLRTFDLTDEGESTQLDGCVPCLALWFDAQELERVGVSLRERDTRNAEVEHAKAHMTAEAMHDNAKFKTAAQLARFLMADIYRHYFWPWW